MYVYLPFLEEKEFDITAFLWIFFLFICVLLSVKRGLGLSMTHKEIFVSFIPIFGFKYLRRLYFED